MVDSKSSSPSGREIMASIIYPQDVSLTAGTGPFGRRPIGRFDFDHPATVKYVEPHRPRVRGMQGETVVIESERVWLVHRTGTLPHYAFPAEDVSIASKPEPALDGYVTV